MQLALFPELPVLACPSITNWAMLGCLGGRSGKSDQYFREVYEALGQKFRLRPFAGICARLAGICARIAGWVSARTFP